METTLAQDLTRFAREHADLAKTEYTGFTERHGPPFPALERLADAKTVETFRRGAAKANRTVNERLASFGREVGRFLDETESAVEAFFGNAKATKKMKRAKAVTGGETFTTVEITEDDF